MTPEQKRIKALQERHAAAIARATELAEADPFDRTAWEAARSEAEEAGAAYQAAVARANPDTEEHAELVSAASVGDVVEAVLSGRPTAGATAELQQALNLDADAIPLSLLETRPENVTSAPAEVDRTTAPLVPWVFGASVSGYLGIAQPRVPVGEAVYVYFHAASVAGTPAESAQQADADAQLMAKTFAPRRAQTSLTFTREDRAKLGGLDAGLRMHVADAVAYALDREALRGAGGLLADGIEEPADPNAESSYQTYVNAVTARVDGRYAIDASDVRLLVGSQTYAHMAGEYRTPTSERSALDRVMELAGGVRVAEQIAAAVGNDQAGLAALGASRGRVSAVMPIWEGVQLVEDAITRLREGEIRLAAIALMDFGLVDAGAFKRDRFQLA